MTEFTDVKTNNLSILIGGEAGYGIMSTGLMLALSASRGGLYVFANNEVPSLIRGGHNTYQVRISAEKIYAHTDKVEFLIALNEYAIKEHKDIVVSDGIIIYDSENYGKDIKDERFRDIPLKQLAIEAGKNVLMRNTVALGALIAFLNYDFSRLEDVIKDNFIKKGDKVINVNIKAAKLGYDYVKNNFESSVYQLKKISNQPKCILDGNEATSLGAVRAGCNFIAAYPMTPATSVWQNITKYAEEFNIVIKQTEDEIAAMNMIIGASYMGARAMTATSGGGFSLMVEALGMAGMTETSCVVVESQRPGPSTGLPTRTDQGDLQFVMHASQGEFPRVVMAPGNPTQAFEMIGEAFNLADVYQLPVIFLLDKYLSSSKFTVKEFDQSIIKIDRGKLIDFDKKIKDYKRYEITEDGISRRALPGSKNRVLVSTDEHIEDGNLREDIDTRVKMVDKRARKLETLKKKLKGYIYYGEKNAKTLFIIWGSTLGPALEAINILNNTSEDIALLQITHFIPFNDKDVYEIMGDKDVYIIEGNSEGQLANLIQEKTGFMKAKRILRYDGRPFTASYIIDKYKNYHA